jgi:tRNA pseudouridine13 synthase
MREPANYPRLVRKIPRGMDIEKRLISSLVAGKDPKAALRAIPITIRRLFVQAYQAFIFNKCLSKCLTSGEDITRPRDGDLVFEMEGEFTFGKVAKYQLGETKPVVPAITLTGYSFRERPGRFEQITNEILKDEGVSPKDFYIKEMDELSQQGGFRQAPLWCKGFSYLKDPLVVSFKLPKGSYATTLLREIMKPADPVGSGF